MLEELQRLQAHIGVLKARVAVSEKEKAAIESSQYEVSEQHHAQIALKNDLLEQKQTELDQVSHNFNQLQTQFNQLNTDATALAERYSRLEKSCTELKNRFQEILSERNELRIIKEKILNEQRVAQQEIQNLEQERELLLKKNEVAKTKVEAIIQRLAILGTAQDQHSQEIQQLAHPTEGNEDATS